ncbi:hypothetical protein, partial [Salmonella enterica]|uniref:hypothetical protein n=1 Tax=Salmonella enterica TaxID=28901 RepID=UPI0020C25ED2
SSFDIEQRKFFETQIAPQLNAISARAIHFEQAFLKETTDFVKDHKSLVKQVNESVEQIKLLETLNDSLFEDVLTTD